MTRAATQERLDQALTRLLAGQSAITDGELTVSNLCREAGAGRDSCYRTPAVVARFTNARTAAATSGTGLAQLRDRAATLAREVKDGKRDCATQVTELEDQATTCAGQIQVLAPASWEPKEENQRLRSRIERTAPGVSQLHAYRRPGNE